MEEKKEDNKKKLLPLLLLPVLAIGIYFAVAQINKPEEVPVIENDNELTPEEVIESLGNNLNEEDHNLKVSIISPEEKTFQVSQARFYKGYYEGNGKYSNQVRCLWQFYINENNEEYLLDEMENRGMVSKESGDVCGFTSTLVNKAGELRVKLTMTAYNSNTGEDLESVSGERKYTVL
jgi:hypothetical protein